jgi:hypothetical protein
MSTTLQAGGPGAAGDAGLPPDPEQLRQAIDHHEKQAGLLRRVLRATLDVLTERPAEPRHAGQTQY